MRPALPVADFLAEEQAGLRLQLIAGEGGLSRILSIPDVNRPGLALAGYLDYFAFDRAQVMGLTEINYLLQLAPDVLEERIKRIFAFDIPCFIISRGLMPPPAFIEAANAAQVPVLRSLLTTAKVVSKAIVFLDEQFSPETRVHGTLVDVHGIGVLILGHAGVGKSEAALELVERGHRLVADDVVSIKRRADRYLYGEGSALVKHHMEIRGLGIVDVRNLFGVGAVRDTKRVRLVIELEDWDAEKEYERLGIDEGAMTLLELRLPKLTVPVRPGRNIAIIIEVAALNQRLKDFGIHTARMLDEQLRSALEADGAAHA